MGKSLGLAGLLNLVEKGEAAPGCTPPEETPFATSPASVFQPPVIWLRPNQTNDVSFYKCWPAPQHAASQVALARPVGCRIPQTDGGDRPDIWVAPLPCQSPCTGAGITDVPPRQQSQHMPFMGRRWLGSGRTCTPCSTLRDVSTVMLQGGLLGIPLHPPPSSSPKPAWPIFPPELT